MVITMRSLILFMVLMLFLAPLSVSSASVSTNYSGQNAIIKSAGMEMEISNTPEVVFHSPGSGEKFFLKYEAVMGYNSAESTFGSSWKIRSSFEDAAWKRSVESGSSPIMGNYTKIEMSALLDGITIHSISQGIPGGPPQGTVSGWCSIIFTITVSDRNYTISTKRGNYTVHGGNEAKIDISITILKDVGIDRVALRQSLSSSDEHEYLLEESGGPRHILPETGMHTGRMKSFKDTPNIEQKMKFWSDGDERAHYFWNSFVNVDGEEREINTHYTQEGGSLVIYTSYPAIVNSRICHDPVIGVPSGSHPIEEVVNFVYDHLMSVMLGIAAGTGAFSLVAYKKSRKERETDDVLNFEESEYFRK